MKKDEAYEKIKQIIIKINPDEEYTISENYFCERLNISRTPVRQALQKLQYEGLINILPHLGIVISSISFEEARQLFDLRNIVEGYLVHRSVNLLNEADFIHLEQIIEQQEQILKNGQYDEYLRYDEEFHLYTYRHYQNEYMKNIVKNFKARFYRARYQSISTPGQGERSIEAHKEIIELLRSGEIETAVEALNVHQKNLETLITKGRISG